MATGEVAGLAEEDREDIKVIVHQPRSMITEEQSSPGIKQGFPKLRQKCCVVVLYLY